MEKFKNEEDDKLKKEKVFYKGFEVLSRVEKYLLNQNSYIYE